MRAIGTAVPIARTRGAAGGGYVAWESLPDTGRMRVAGTGGENRHGMPDVVHRLAQPGRHLPNAGRGGRPRRFDPVLLVLAHDSIVLRATAGARACTEVRSRAPSQTSQLTPFTWVNGV